MASEHRWACILVVGLAALAIGCGSKADAPTTDEPAANAPSPEQQKDIETALSELSDDDRALAEKQRTCPVTGELLGSMGPPPKVEVEGREVFLCCAGCEDPLKEDPAKYLANLEEK